ncbi:MAG: radical SAM protein, partial [Bacteroidetes bacterium]|nr:radical SAM protein [Bacteroidota bacterium]
MADRLMEIGIDVPFLSIMTPFKGTSLYEKLNTENRILTERGWNFYNGYNVAFQPKNMSPTALLHAHRTLWKRSFGIVNSVKRIFRAIRLRRGAFLMVLFMNGFYCLKRLRRNYPADMLQKEFQLPKPLAYTELVPEQFFLK